MSRFWKKKKTSMNEQEKEQEIVDKDQAEVTGEQPEQPEATESGEIEVEVTGQEGNAASPGSLEEAMEAIAKLQLELRTAKAEAKDAQETSLRLQADFVNFRKRQEKEAANTIRFANEDLLLKLLPILDNFDRTLATIEKTDNLSAIKEGIVLVEKNMRKQLNKVGLEPVEAKGKEFDSELHEAITAVPVEDEGQKGKVIDEVEKGYKLKDRVIRYAKVVVGE